MAKTLIAFFSHAGENYVGGSVRFLERGNNEVIVDKIKALLPDADVFRIETVKNYKEDYYELIEEAKQELRSKARPELTAKVENMDQYDTIYLGWPCWWGTYPMCVATFLEAHDWKGKTVIPFTTHEGSGFGQSLRDLKAAIPGATITKGLSIQGSKVGTAGNQIEKFVTGDK